MPKFNKPVTAFVFQKPVVTRICPLTPFVDVAVFHRVVVNVVQRREIVTLTSHDTIRTAKPNLAAFFIVLFVKFERCSAMKLSLALREQFNVQDLHEDMIVVR